MKIIQYSVISLLLILSACGGKKVVNTTDDSADYQSARQLPPLKKSINTASSPVASSSDAQTTIDTTSVDLREDQRNIQYSVIDASKGRKRLKIDSQFDTAWSFLLQQLRAAAITIQSRNKGAARVEVGCGVIDDGVNLVKKKGWTILNRENVIYDYCVMKLDESGDTTIVSVQNRRAEEVEGSEAMTLFNKFVQQ